MVQLSDDVDGGAPVILAAVRQSGQDVWWMKTNAQINRPRGLWQGSPCPRAATPS